MAFLPEADHLLSLQPLELAFDLGESQLYRIPLWAVAHVVNPPEAQLTHRLLALFGPMDVELVHEEADLVVVV